MGHSNHPGGICKILRRTLKSSPIATLILLVSFVTFVWLVVDTTSWLGSTRRDSPYEKIADEVSLQSRWSESSVQIFFDLLEIETNITALLIQDQVEPCPLKGEIVFTAFVDDTLEGRLWQYYTLIALRQSLTERGMRVKSYLPKTTKQRLEQLFTSVPMEVIGELSFDCYDMGSAHIISSTTDIPLPRKQDQIYILDSGSRRYQNLIETDWSREGQMLQITKSSAAAEYLYKLTQKSPSTRLHHTALEFVGIYIRLDDALPFDYYYRAIAFQRKLQSARLIFVVICEEPHGNLCQKINAPQEEVYVQPSGRQHPGYDFALMSLCNHTIISNQVGIFHALYNGRDTVVYEFEDSEQRLKYVPWLVASELYNWYMLS
ncbi:uncharacterized protein LOC129762610 [Toxorhynchites rutilus septentrionalis]|uniref:uncharacterized protein LOC129762610 n=1 Tax=Toxorhynchites rutilus septentrionalis TaxID=329112 RepID=UPI00247B1C66|nr:uncharacterized protein LOC129762610 [Toxorhynchites rutilus septentrionalis]